ncbi:MULTISPECIES: hypothetical protein [Bacillus cereus group]|uniref:hypothetical protein n=1 Tax=Bacillus cereus group TaxID=86661 RepID=UPI00159714AF|nr:MULTISPECIES: hypothetical protein [Bacillus cereus group]
MAELKIKKTHLAFGEPNTSDKTLITFGFGYLLLLLFQQFGAVDLQFAFADAQEY